MKKLLLLVLVAISVFSSAQTTIKMEKDGGIYKVQCKVNGAPMKMYFDTGASVVSISKATAIYLITNDLVDETDYLGIAKATIADGTVEDNMVIRLKDIEIGGLHLKNVEATISSSLNAPLLLGQTVISKLGKITLNGDILIIHSSNSQSLSKEEREELDNKLRVLRANIGTDLEANYKILDIVKKIEKSEELNEYELFCKLISESNENLHDEAIRDAGTWIEKYALDTDSMDLKMRTYFTSANSNIISENGNKELGMQHLKRCSSYFAQDTTAHFFWHHLPNIYYLYCKYKGNGYLDAIFASKASIRHFLKLENTNLKEINANKQTDSPLQFYFGYLSFLYVEEYLRTNNTQWTNNQLKMANLTSILAAKVGNQKSKEYCNQFDIDYKKPLTQKELDFVGIEDN